MDIKLTNKLLQVYFDWGRIEENEIIDFNLIGQKNKFPQVYKSRQELYQAFREVKQDFIAKTTEDRYLLSKINGSLAYLDALDNNPPPFSQYIEQTMGVTPILFSDKYIDNLLTETKNAYQKLGVKYTRKDLKKFAREQRLTKEEIVKSFNSFRDKWLPKFLDWLGIEVLLDYDMEFVEQDVYWMNWIKTQGNGKILLQFNVHKGQPWTRGWTEYLMLHELCGHMVQMLCWKKEIIQDRMNPVVGLTTTFTPDQFIMEGIGEALLYFLPFNPLSEHGRITFAADHLYWAVMNNLHIMANQEKSEEEIYKFTSHYLPKSTRKDIKKDIKEKTLDPLARTYQYSYGIGRYYFKQLSEKLSASEKKKFIQQMYTEAIAPRDIIQECNLH